MVDALVQDKTGQRRLLRQRLSAHGEAERMAAGRRVAEQLVFLPEWEGAKSVVLYASLPGEPDTDLLFWRARKEGKRVFYPFFRGEDRSLGFAEVETLESLHVGPLRFREPSPAKKEQVLEADLMLIPGLGFDQRGMRLGRGCGYYDRTLAEISAGLLRVGLFFSWQELPRVAAKAHDEQMDLLVTEREVIRVRRR
ncbi:5-formyltetrahydrofolate cyclo-ligase [Verrucomicrobium sp. 3C]|uniref:5-formyltetrahydrofolate cyclo-ligase n=1 Tax=Verrucomicrobium sp. 3C TaxID=1134055 RepID=UPI00039C96BE|nr:5-formyltetrahydrofolate cyclo-ligase [Verrucomicrobium sp. 3C]